MKCVQCVEKILKVNKLWVSLQWRWAAFSSSTPCETTLTDGCGYKNCIMYYIYVICWAAYLKARHRKASRTHTHAHEASRHHMTIFDDCDNRQTHIHYSSSLTLQAPQPPSAVSSQPQYISPLMNTQAHFTSPVVNTQLSFFIFLVVFKPSSPHLTQLSMYQVLKMPQMVRWKHCPKPNVSYLPFFPLVR